MNRVDVKPQIIIWAREHAQLAPADLVARFPKLADWEEGVARPTLKQAEAFAKAVHVPIGYLFLPSPPRETVPIPDFRTVGNDKAQQLSVNALDTIYWCQQRQDWFRDYARLHRLKPVFVANNNAIADSPVVVARRITETLDFSVAARRRLPTWEKALRQFVDKAEALGILVMASSIVGSNTHRALSVEEFRGFALADDLAPLIFINAADSKAAQIFTLAHELAHLWIGESGISAIGPGERPRLTVERWCNEVAAELLAPADLLKEDFQKQVNLTDELQRLARHYKVSTLVILRRLRDTGSINQNLYKSTFEQEWQRVIELHTRQKASGGGDFYRTLRVRNSNRFTSAVLESTFEGQTLFQDAFRMLGIKKTATLYNAARQFGVLS